MVIEKFFSLLWKEAEMAKYQVEAVGTLKKEPHRKVAFSKFFYDTSDEEALGQAMEILLENFDTFEDSIVLKYDQNHAYTQIGGTGKITPVK